MKASEWEKEDAMSEGIPIVNNRPPLEFVHENGKLKGVLFQRVKQITDESGRQKTVPTGEPDIFMEADHVLMAIGQENHCPWIERDIGIDFDRWECPVLDRDTLQSTHPKVFFGGDSAFGPENIIWAAAHAHKAAISIHLFCQGLDLKTDRPPEGVNLVSQKMGMHEWSYDSEHDAFEAASGAARRSAQVAEEHQDGSRTRLRSQTRRAGNATLPELRRADGVHRQAVHRVRRVRRHLSDGLHHVHAERRGTRTASEPHGAGAEQRAGSVRLPPNSEPAA